MIVGGVLLLIVGLLLGSSIVWTIGIILIAIGALLWILGAIGRPMGRPHYY